MLGKLLLSVLLAALCPESNAYPSFQARIPNGNKVPNPCNMSTIWPGVGHQNRGGGGARNPFGQDFKANNLVWNRTICEKDSDGDGLTNGQELGDPDCTWTVGSTPTFSTNLSHPGICEPLGSSLCSAKNIWLMNCVPGKLNCPAINEPGVRNHTLRFPVTTVPTKETTYMCYQFALPIDTVSDMIAFEPVIDNAERVHHMMLYACNNKPTDHSVDETYECGMGSTRTCLSLVGVWGIGLAGQCLNNQLGFRFGPGALQFAVVVIHYYNPQHKVNQTDTSGMMIHYTTQLRPNSGQIAAVGQVYLEIPSGQNEVTFTGSCVSACTKKLPHSIFLVSSFLHMHLLGQSGETRLIRNGTLLRVMDSVTGYSYNAPTLTEFENPIEVKPGDEIQVKCVYQSTQKNSTTFYGEEISDEMCYAFFAYYPFVEDVGTCFQWKSINICNTNRDIEFDACDVNTFLTLITLLPKVCAKNCSSTYCAGIIDLVHDTGCQNFPDAMTYCKTFLPINAAMLEKCTLEMPPKPTTRPGCPRVTPPGRVDKPPKDSDSSSP